MLSVSPRIIERGEAQPALSQTWVLPYMLMGHDMDRLRQGFSKMELFTLWASQFFVMLASLSLCKAKTLKL